MTTSSLNSNSTATTATTTTSTKTNTTSGVEPSASSTTTPPNGPVDVDNSRTIGVLLAFAIVGIGLVSGILIYIWHKSKTDEGSKYVTLSDRLGGSSATINNSRPTTSSNADVNFTNINITANDGRSNPFAPPPQSRQTNFVNGAFEHNMPQSQWVAQQASRQNAPADPENPFKFDQFNNRDKDRNSETSF
jgi:hypothetical protein